MICGMALAAWAMLFWLHGVPAGHHMHSAHSMSTSAAGGQGITGGLEGAAFFLATWLLMTVAMMLPTILPLVNLFRQTIAGRENQPAMTAMLLAGYLGVWACFGVTLSAIGLVASRWRPSDSFPEMGRLLGPVLFLVAGIFQFLPAKQRCLDKCHASMDSGFGCRSEARPLISSLSLGIRHGLSCVGCCWALMLLMFAAGSAHLVWMLALTAAIVVEKNLPWGRHLAKPMGVLLLSCSAFAYLLTK